MLIQLNLFQQIFEYKNYVDDYHSNFFQATNSFLFQAWFYNVFLN